MTTSTREAHERATQLTCSVKLTADECQLVRGDRSVNVNPLVITWCRTMSHWVYLCERFGQRGKPGTQLLRTIAEQRERHVFRCAPIGASERES